MNFGHRKSKPALGADQSSEAIEKEKVNKYRGVAQFGSIEPEARPADDEAKAKWRSGQNS